MPPVRGTVIASDDLFEFGEDAKWIIERKKILDEHASLTDDLLSDASAKGFVVPPGSSMTNVLKLDVKAKLTLEAANAKLLNEQQESLFQGYTAEQKALVADAKSDARVHQNDLENRISMLNEDV